jgi:hypothetical protein
MKFLSLILFFILFACTKEEFNQSTKTETSASNAIVVNVEERCTNFTPPPIDILLLIDNSRSINLILTTFKTALSNIVKAATGFHDFRIYIAPLVPKENEAEIDKKQFQLITNSPINLPITTKIVGLNDVKIPGEFYDLDAEQGISRSIALLKTNSKISSGSNLLNIFREKAYSMVILLSNGDDRTFKQDAYGNLIDDGTFNQLKNELLGIKTSLNSLSLRFLTVVNHTSCGASVPRPGEFYKQMSRSIYNAQNLTDSNGTTEDSYDMCSNSLETVFEEISKTVENFKRGHIYNKWPLGENLDFDPSKLVVVKKISGAQVPRDDNNGFKFIEQFQSNVNIREIPPVEPNIPAELYSGYFLELSGNGKVAYPDCLVVRKEDFDKFYGYIVLNDEPNPETLKIVINGKEIPQSDSNGWKFIGFQESVNTLVKSREDLSSITPGIFKTGYVIKLFGNAVYSDGAKVEVHFKGAPL